MKRRSKPTKIERNKKSSASLVKILRKYHKWPALVISFFLLLFAVSGIILNHRSFFSSVDIPRNWLPSEYRYYNWNLAAVKSSLNITADSVFIYGNIGVWLTDAGFSGFSDYTSGFPAGADSRKIFSMLETANGHIYAGAQSGLYRLDRNNSFWEQVSIPVNEKRVAGMTQKNDSIIIMTRSNLLIAKDCDNPDFKLITLPPAINDDQMVSLFRTLWLIHSGKIFGAAGKIFVDIMGLILIFLIFSGLLHYFAPGLLKRVSGLPARSKIKRVNRVFIKWHNKLGSMAIFFFLIITITGMFLRPPLLISIVRTKVPVLKNTWLDNPNPWFDKLRDIIWDEERQIFLYSTSEGIYYSDPHFSAGLIPFPVEPPVSVMGVNVFEKSGSGEFIVGSFSGIYRWVPEKAEVRDYITGHPVTSVPGLASPFGSLPVSGRLEYNGGEVIFDYARGAMVIPGSMSTNTDDSPQTVLRHANPSGHNPGSGLAGQHEPAQVSRKMAAGFTGDRSRFEGSPHGFMPMPEIVKENSPLPLWNLALEVHTGRIFSPLVGDFYVLYIPVMGIVTLVVLITGLLIWVKKKRRKNGSG